MRKQIMISILFIILSAMITLVFLTGCENNVQAGNDPRGQNIKTITGIPSPDPNDPPGFDRLRLLSPQASPQRVPGDWAFYDNAGNPRAYYIDPTSTKSYVELKGEVDRLKTGSINMNDIQRLKIGFSQEKVEWMLGKEKKVISDNPPEMEYILDNGTVVILDFKAVKVEFAAKDTVNINALTSVNIMDNSGNKSPVTLAPANKNEIMR